MLRLLNLAILFMVVFTTFAEAEEKIITVTIKSGSDTETKSPFTGSRSAVDVALLLDTSNSMDGLISQAKNQLWTIVQEFAHAEKQGKTPLLRVALFEYGNTGLPASENYIRQVVQLTDDLDELSEALFALRTNGGDEYCGAVIQEALARLDWTNEPNSYKAIFIAGNEPFTQGGVNYKDSCRQAIEAGVIVNTIHCGNYEAGVEGKWSHGAQLAEGEYFNIDQDRKEIPISCPQDKIILKLNAELNKTYLWFGDKDERQLRLRRQYGQDALAQDESDATLVQRAAAKASSVYRNEGRDLVDALANDEQALERLSEKELPEAMQKMSDDERREHVQKLTIKRKELQDKIAELNKERSRYAAEKRAELVEEGAGATLGEVVVGAVRKQLAKSGFEIKTEAGPDRE